MSDRAADQAMVEFFISYTQSDRSWAEWIAWQLEANGYSVIVQAWDFAAGQNFVVEMNLASARSARTIAILSTEYLASRFATSEWTVAFARDPTGESRTLIPVRVGGAPPVGLLAPIGWVDFVDCDEETALMRLLAAASGTRAKPARKPAYPGAHEEQMRPKPRFPMGLPPIWNVPARNRHFTGRSELLARLRPELADRERVVVAQTIAGLGGIGKTQLAIEYAYRHAAEYDLVWWVRAETEETRHSDLLALARRLSISDLDALAPDAQIAALRSALAQRENWILIFDNVEEPSAVAALMPQIGGGHVLITSRNAAWGTLAQVVELDVWSPTEAAKYLAARTGEDNLNATAELAEMLGYLPLAIEQAAAYIDESRISPGQYSDMFRRSRARLLRASSGKVTVATIWSLSIRAVEAESKNAVTLLQLLAFLPPDGFPRERLLRVAASPPKIAASLLESELSLNEAVAILRRYSLIEATREAVSVHRLVQAVVQDALPDDQHRLFSQAAHRLQHGISEQQPSENVSPFPVPRFTKSVLIGSGGAGLVVLAVVILWFLKVHPQQYLDSSSTRSAGQMVAPTYTPAAPSVSASPLGRPVDEPDNSTPASRVATSTRVARLTPLFGITPGLTTRKETEALIGAGALRSFGPIKKSDIGKIELSFGVVTFAAGSEFTKNPFDTVVSLEYWGDEPLPLGFSTKLDLDEAHRIADMYFVWLGTQSFRGLAFSNRKDGPILLEISWMFDRRHPLTYKLFGAI